MLLLTHEECERIHAGALEVLWETGVRVDDPAIVKLMAEAGCRVTAECVVHVPESLVGWAIRQAPKHVRMADRAGKMYDLTPGGDCLVATGNALYVAQGKARRDLCADDLAELARVVDACPNIGAMVGTTVADYPATTRDFVGFRIMAQNTAKHLRPCIYTPRGGRIVLVEQNARQALAIADYAYVLEAGCIASAGTGQDLLEDPVIRKAYLGAATG